MILLAIEVVLIFTFTSSDNFTLSFYNLISFVQTYDPVYKNDTPEHIFSHDGGTWFWFSSPGTHGNSMIFDRGSLSTYSTMTASAHLYQRPVLCLHNV